MLSNKAARHRQFESEWDPNMNWLMDNQPGHWQHSTRRAIRPQGALPCHTLDCPNGATWTITLTPLINPVTRQYCRDCKTKIAKSLEKKGYEIQVGRIDHG